VTVYFQILALLFLSFVLADSSGDAELCLKCLCHKKVLIKPLYTVSCSHLGLQDTFRNLEQWPEYSRQQETRMAVNFDWNDIKHLKKFPNISGIVSLSLQHNKMTKIEGSAFVELDNLKVLDLSYNQLTGNQTYELNLTLLRVLIGTSNIIQLFCDAVSTEKEYMLSTVRFKEKDSKEFEAGWVFFIIRARSICPRCTAAYRLIVRPLSPCDF